MNAAAALDDPPTAAPPRPTTASVNLRVDVDLRRRLDLLAERTGLTVSQLSRVALEDLADRLEGSRDDAIVIPIRRAGAALLGGRP